jgi:hypothetical protein
MWHSRVSTESGPFVTSLRCKTHSATSFALGRALWETGGDKARARALVERALTHTTSFQSVERAAEETWLSKHGSNPEP